MGWLLLILAIVIIIVWVHMARGMSSPDRITAALDIVETAHFEPAEGFDEARREDPELVGWAKAHRDCIMLFRSQQGDRVQEVVDVASSNFHPGLVVHYLDGRAVKTDAGSLSDQRHCDKAEELLRRIRQVMRQVHPPQLNNYDGFHY